MAGIVGNRYYNNPQIGAAFSNIAQLFAPPSGADLAGYAAASAKREEAARLAELFTYAQTPEVDQGVFDRMGQATGQWNPANGYYGVDVGAATTRRGQDIAARTDLQKQRLANEGRLAELYATPISVAENATVYLPDQTAKATGLAGTLTGQASVGQGEIVHRADGSVLKGETKPLSETEWQALQKERLRATGQITDQMIIDGVMGERSPVQAVGEGGKPVFMTPGEATRTGAEAFVNKGSQAAPTNYVTPDGRQGTARPNDNGVLVDTQDGTPIPPGSRLFGTNVQGSALETGIGPTTANNTAANDQAAQITQALNMLDLYENLVSNNPAAVGFAGLVRGTAQNAVAAAQDLASAFGGSVPDAQKYADQIREGLGDVAPEMFDPNIGEANFLQGALAYSIARTENPRGEVSRQMYERALERISGGVLANSKSIQSSIKAFRDVLNTQLSSVNTLRDPGSARTDTAYPGGQPAPQPGPTGAERWIRGPDGRPMRAN